MKTIVTIIFTIALFLNLNAQETKEYYKDEVLLKNGSKIYGQILDYNFGGEVQIKLLAGQVLKFPDSVVKKIEIYSPEIMNESIKINNANYPLKNGKIYNYVNFKFIAGTKEQAMTFKNGIGFEYNIGYRFNHYFSIGAGTGIETFNYGLGEIFIPLNIDLISFINNKKISPFLRFQAGYGFVFSTEDSVTDSNGGLLLNPAFGIKIGSQNNINYTVDMNFKYQKADFFYFQNNWREPRVSYRDIIFRRLSIRFGTMF